MPISFDRVVLTESFFWNHILNLVLVGWGWAGGEWGWGWRAGRRVCSTGVLGSGAGDLLDEYLMGLPALRGAALF